MKNIKWIQLRPDDVLNDIDFRLMSAEQRGVFWTLLLLLYCNNGKLEYNPANLKELCNCRNFEKIWKNLSKKFSTRNGVIKHKRVTKELKKVKKFLQDKKKAGLKGAKKRWHSQSDDSDRPIASETETKRSVNVNKTKETPNTRENNTQSQSLDSEQKSTAESNLESASGLSNSFSSNSARPKPDGPLAAKTLRFNMALRQIITPRTSADLTSFRNIGNWLAKGITAGKFDEDIFKRVLDYAAEACEGRVRNPAAVFTAKLKKELGYLCE